MDAQQLVTPGGPSLTLVELFALPGAGKTTVVEAARQRACITTRKDLSAQWGSRSAMRRISHVARSFGNSARVATAARFGRDAPIATPEGLFRLMRLVAKTDWLASRSGALLLDQGFLQDLWSILLAGKAVRSDPLLIAPLIRTAYHGIDATIVAIDVDPEVAATRILERQHGDSRFDGLPEAELRDALRSASGLHDRILEAAKLAGLPVIGVDGAVPPQQIADRLLTLSTLR